VHHAPRKKWNILILSKDFLSRSMSCSAVGETNRALPGLTPRGSCWLWAVAAWLEGELSPCGSWCWRRAHCLSPPSPPALLPGGRGADARARWAAAALLKLARASESSAISSRCVFAQQRVLERSACFLAPAWVLESHCPGHGARRRALAQ